MQVAASYKKPHFYSKPLFHVNAWETLCRINGGSKYGHACPQNGRWRSITET